MNEKNLFLVFGTIQALSLGFIVYFMLGLTGAGLDTRLVLSFMFPVFSLALEYMIYSKR